MTQSTSLPRAVISTLTDTDTIRLTDVNVPEIAEDYSAASDSERVTQWGRVTFLPSEDPATVVPSALMDLPRTELLKYHAIPYVPLPTDYSIGAIGISEDRQFYLDLLRVQETEESTQISVQRVEDVRPLVHLFERESIGGMSSPAHDRRLRDYKFAPVSNECINRQGQMKETPHTIPLESHDGIDLGRLYFYSPCDECKYLANGQVVLLGASTDPYETSSRFSIVMDQK